MYYRATIGAWAGPWEASEIAAIRAARAKYRAEGEALGHPVSMDAPDLAGSMKIVSSESRRGRMLRASGVAEIVEHIRTACDGDTIVVDSAAAVELGQRAHRRMRPGLAVTFTEGR